MKSTMILPCGVSSAAKRAYPGAAFARSAVTSPLRNLRAASPATLTTPRSGRSAAFMRITGWDRLCSERMARTVAPQVGQVSNPPDAKLLATRALYRLLPRRRQREFAAADARREAFGKTRNRLLSISGRELGKGREEARLRQAVAVDAFEPRLVPGAAEVTHRGALEFKVSGRIGDLHNLNCHSR